MQHYIDTHRVFSGMRQTNDKGLVIGQAHAKNINKVNVAKRAYFQTSIKGDAYISEPLLSSTSGKPILVISSPVKSGGKVVGV